MRTSFLILLLALTIVSCQNTDNSQNNSSKKTPTPDTSANIQPSPADPATDTPTTTADTDTMDLGAPMPSTTKTGMYLAYINSNEILLKLPAVKQADKQLQEFAKRLDSELMRKQQELQEKYQRYMQDTAVAQSILEMRAKELDQLQRSIQELQYNSEQQMAKKKQELYDPILNRIDQAINAVAKREGFTHVFDVANGGLVYSEDRFNATPLVLRQLGLQ